MSRHDSERRRSPRAPLLRDVQIHGNGKTSAGRLVDLSTTGAFLETSEEFNLDDSCQLAFTLPGGKALTVDCIVCYLHAGLGIGVEFTKLSTEDSNLIKECIASLK